MIFLNEITITNKGGRLTVASLQVATDFGKQHKDVIKSIENLLRETSAKNFANLTAENFAMKSFFIESTYVDSYGRQQKCYDITRDSFSLLVMGFTGKKALSSTLRFSTLWSRNSQTETTTLISLSQRLSLRRLLKR